jgi:hypothetical protein
MSGKCFKMVSLLLQAFAVATMLSGLPGCETLKAINFQEAKGISGITANQETRVAYLTDRTEGKTNEELSNVFSKEIKVKLNERCIAGTQKATPLLLIPLIAAGGQLVFQLATDSLATAVKGVRDRAQPAPYSARANVDVPILQADSSKECIL